MSVVVNYFTQRTKNVLQQQPLTFDSKCCSKTLKTENLTIIFDASIESFCFSKIDENGFVQRIILFSKMLHDEPCKKKLQYLLTRTKRNILGILTLKFILSHSFITQPTQILKTTLKIFPIASVANSSRPKLPLENVLQKGMCRKSPFFATHFLIEACDVSCVRHIHDTCDGENFKVNR